ncbi:fructose-bisphosphatase class II family protein [Pseudonocardia sp. RS11V-5]|nr:fructose-bisphosphatase class II family protein [Pseudonocardia terrae]
MTEAAAIAAGRWVGRGERNSGEAAAVAMYDHLGAVAMRGTVVIGRGERNDAPVLFPGDDVGSGDGPVCDVGITVGDDALPPGELPTGEGVANPLAAIAVTEPGALYAPPPDVVVEKVAVGPDYAGVVDITRPVAENLRAVAAVKGVPVSDVVVAVADGRRHRELATAIRDAGARVHALQGGDVAGAIAAARPEGPVDVLLGTGGAGEAVVAAAALFCMGGSLQVRLRSDGVDTVLHTGDLVRGGRVLFCATGVTSSELLCGVRNHSGRTTTQSMVLCSEPDTVWMVGSEQRSA